MRDLDRQALQHAVEQVCGERALDELQLVGRQHRHEAGRGIDDVDVDVEADFLEIAALLRRQRRADHGRADGADLDLGLRLRGERARAAGQARAGMRYGDRS